MKKHVVIFEARGGTDKGPYGFRKDSKPIIDSLKKRGWTAEIIFYRDEDRGEIYRYTHEKADAYISRVNPGNLNDETGYFQMLRELVMHGIEGLPHPDAMVADFILDTDKKTGKDKYVLGEINASCVGFSTHLELSDNIANEVLDLMDAESVVNNKWGAFTK